MPIRILLVATLFLLTACATSPTGRQQLLLVSNAQIAEMGVTAFQQMKQKIPVVKDPRVRGYVTCVANAITAQLPGGQRRHWEVAVFKDDSANAFALPGGKIGVHTGLLKIARNQDQLATVIGHEVAHVLAQHSAERISQQFATQAGLDLVAAMVGGGQTQQQLMSLLGLGAQVGVLLPYSRLQESEADIYGLELMAKAGFDPRASVQLWQSMKRAGGGAPTEWLSTHPAPDTRINDLRRQIPQVMPYYNEAVLLGHVPDCA
ncbi:MAG: M48 family metallopeptidase [Salinisphaera sp.]|nr:M48 family metallopeptidase [Salinisphaera sp.]